MDNEFNNNDKNQFGEASGDQNQYQSFENKDDTALKSDINSIGNDYTNNENLYSIYPEPQVKASNKKEKKKHKIPGTVKLAASAIAFGVIAGTVFQGMNYITNKNEAVIIEQNNNQEATAITGSTKKNTEGTIVPVNTSKDTLVSDVSGVVESVMPSIVAINSSATVTNYDFFGRQFSQPVEGSGSGIIIGQNDNQILIVTNNHVIQDSTKVEVVLSDKSTVSATIKGTDSNADLAVLSVNKKDLSKKTAAAIKIATLGDSSKIKAGEMAIAIGNALGYGQSVTVGYISAVNREVTIDNKTMNLLQTDAAINPGNSGGALINANGEVIGINSVKYASEEVEGMGYAIPISKAVPMINELMNRDVVKKSEQGYLGINKETAQNVTDVTAESFQMPIGIYINEVVKNSPAEKAGLKQGNIIVGVDNVKVETIDDLTNILSYKKSGDVIKLKIKGLDKGDYVAKTLTVTLADRP